MRNTNCLTGLRGVAALWVAAFHSFNYFFVFTLFAPLYPHIPFLIGINPHTPKLISHGFYGVDLFFMLSGFSLTLGYWQKFKDNGLKFYKPYIIARFARIYPAYIIIVIIGAVTVALQLTYIPAKMGTWQQFISSFPLMLFLLHDIFYNSIASAIKPFWWYNAPLWSASIEWVAYLFVPFLFVVLNRFKTGLVIVIGVVCICALQYILLFHAPTFLGQPVKEIAYFFYGIPGLTRYFLEFIAGCSACLFALKIKSGFASYWADLVSIGALILLISCVVYFPHVGCFLALFSIFLIFSVQSDTFIAKTLGGRFFVGLGKISYCLYLSHYVVLHMFIQYFLKTQTYLLLMHSEFYRIAFYVCFWICALCVAVALYHFIEKPARQKIRSKYNLSI